VDNYSPSPRSSHNNSHGSNYNGNSPTRRTSSYTIPSQMKRAVATYAPRFAGCAQHDSQEFLAYLLDGLHEDLNCICPLCERVSVSFGEFRFAAHSFKLLC